MANMRGSGVGFAPFDPEVQRDRSVLPGVYPQGSATAEATQVVAGRLAAKVGALADQLAQNDGRRAGLAAGADPNFKPTGGWTIRDQAFDRAAVDTYMSNLSARFHSDALDLYEQHKDDPAGFKTAYDGLVAGYRTEHVFPEIDGAFQAQATTLGTSLRRSALDGWNTKVKDGQTADLLTGMADRDTAGQRLLATNPNDPDTTAAYLRIQNENQAAIKAMVDAGTITAVQGQKMIDAAGQSAQVGLYAARAEALPTAADVEALRGKVRQDFAAGGLPGLSDWASLDTALGQIANKKRTTTDVATRQLAGDIDDFLARARSGTDGAADWAVLERSGAALGPAGEAMVDQARRKLAALRAINGLPPDQAAAYAEATKTVMAGRQGALMTAESGGRPGTVNGFGYAGLWQFGAPRLAELGLYQPGADEDLPTWSKTPKTQAGKWSGTFTIPGHPEVRTLPDFLASPEAQRAAYDAHVAQMDKDIAARRLDRYIGETVGGVTITRAGIHNMMHLGGADGAARFLFSGGADNPADANGTTLADYAALGAKSQSGPSASDADFAKWLDATVDEHRKLVTTDPLAAAARAGTIDTIAPLDLQAPPADLAVSMRNRVAQADAVAASFQRSPVYLRPDDLSALKSRLDKGGDEALGTIMGIVQGAGPSAPQVLKEIGDGAPALAHAALVALSTNDMSFARQVAEAQKTRADGGNLPQPDTSVVDQNVVSELGTALASLDPGELARTRAAALDWATVQIARRGLDPRLSNDVPAIVQEGLQRARGQTKVGDQTFGGIGTVKYGGGYFRDDIRVQLPTDVKSDRFGDVLDALTDDDLAHLQDPPVAPDGKPIKASALRRNAPFFAPGGYLFGMPDEATGTGVLIMAKSGQPFVLPFDELRPTLRTRVPDAFR